MLILEAIMCGIINFDNKHSEIINEFGMLSKVMLKVKTKRLV
jgi:hypothetical protein